MITSKKVLVLLSAVVLCLSLSMVGPVNGAKASACYELLFSDDCTNTSFTTFVLLFSDFTFVEASGGFGDWGTFGPSFYIQFWDGCQEFLSGTKKLGFFQCTDGTTPGGEIYPGCWQIKKSKACSMLDKEARDGKGSESNASPDFP